MSSIRYQISYIKCSNPIKKKLFCININYLNKQNKKQTDRSKATNFFNQTPPTLNSALHERDNDAINGDYSIPSNPLIGRTKEPPCQGHATNVALSPVSAFVLLKQPNNTLVLIVNFTPQIAIHANMLGFLDIAPSPEAFTGLLPIVCPWKTRCLPAIA
jgi:hypothetical protein